MRFEERLKGYLGLAARAGRMQSGEDTIVKTVQAAKACRLFLDEEAGENTRDRMLRLSQHHQIGLTFVAGLGQTIGKPGRMAAVLTDEGFEKAIKKLINEYRGGVDEE